MQNIKCHLDYHGELYYIGTAPCGARLASESPFFDQLVWEIDRPPLTACEYLNRAILRRRAAAARRGKLARIARTASLVAIVAAVFYLSY